MDIKEGVDLAGLSQLIGWMKENGVQRLRTGPVEIERVASDSPPPAADTKPDPELTEEQRAKAIQNKRRQRYEKELGRKLTDEDLRMLP